jgi:hypothetical protein
MKKLVLGLIGVSSLLTISAKAVSVQEMGIGNNEVVSITSSTLGGPVSVYAGIVNLQVDGVPTQGFCIDPYHWSVSGPQTYSLVPLTSAPKPPGGPMNAATATQIEQLWGHYFSSALSSSSVAAGLQIAIWELVTGAGNSGNSGTFTLNSHNDYGASTFISWVDSTPNAPTTDLVGLTGPGQDYVIPSGPQDSVTPSVPDGGATVILLGLASLGLVLTQRKLKLRAC